MTILYLHGFNSAPQSHKAQAMHRYMAARGLGARFVCPALPHHPDEAIALVERAIAAQAADGVTLVGSSLGGFYATHLAERLALRAVLLNPAVRPGRDLESYLGVQRNLYTGAEYELTRAHLDAWRRLDVAAVHPERYLLIVETGDEVLDYRAAVAHYPGARHTVLEGGDHSFTRWGDYLDPILQFAGLLPR